MMETKANHILVGALTMAILAIAVVFAVWLGRTEIDDTGAFFFIRFEAPISGLSESGDVRFNGIKVGRVHSIDFDPNDPENVRVRIEVDTDTPIREDSMATLEVLGVTGVSFVQISGGTLDSQQVPMDVDGPIREIAAGRSAISEMLASTPELIRGAITLMDEVTLLIGGQNRESVETILNNVAKISDTMASRDHDVETLIHSAAMLLTDLTKTARSVNRLARGFTDLAHTANDTMANADTVLAGDVRTLVADMRQLVQSMDRVVLRLESDPARFLFGDQSQGYQAR